MSDEETREGRDQTSGPVSPDPKKLRVRTAKVPRRLKRLWKYAIVPADPPTRFVQSREGLISDLAGPPETAELVLEEALAALADPEERIDSAERRSTTLLGSVAIAAAISGAGGSLLVDSSKVQNHEWRIVLAAALALFVGALVMCAVRALSVTGRIFVFEEPGFDDIPERAKQAPHEARLARAADVLRACGVADEIADVKVGLFRAAVFWFRIALAILALFVGLLTAYVIADTDGQQITQTVTTGTTVTVTSPAETVTVTSPPRTVTVPPTPRR